MPPRVFISYSWDDDHHREWVRNFASHLRGDGVNVRLDAWHTGPGDNTPEFMEREVRESDFILCVCTPLYKERFEKRKGGVGYEAELITNEYLVNRNQRKFIPILRKDDWKRSSPSWLMGTYYIDLSGDPYNEKNYRELLATLLGGWEKESTIGSTPASNGKPVREAAFVNRDIELATLDPTNLHKTYWQYALITAPTGYGKTRLIERLLEQIQKDPELNERWTYRYIDMRRCGSPNQAIRYTVEQVTGESVTSDMVDEEGLKKMLCNYIHEKMSTSPVNRSLRHVLLIVDSIDFINSGTVEWFSSVLHDAIVDSYADYETDNASFAVRVLIAGTDTETFLQNYQKWEEASRKYRLKPPQKLALSAFDDLPVQELVQRRAAKEEITLNSTTIQDVSYELQYLSGGHPRVVADILEELAIKKFRKYKDFFRDNHEQLIKNYVSEVADIVLRRFPLSQAKKDIKTVCVFRLINLNTLQNLRDENLVFEIMDINVLGQLCEGNILTPPNAEIFFYHDNIIRRILYLDLAHGVGKDDEHIQKTHCCARSLYCNLIQSSHHSLHLFFVEWLFHSLQIRSLSNNDILSEWGRLLSSIKPNDLPLNDVKRTISEKLNKDGEVKYLFRERYGLQDFSALFESMEGIHD